ncbi:MAG TPA: hypothetical protein DEP19_02780 [Anaerolineae bacterium]|nr:hypothetical protein [Anaerolineae bacterium]
METNSQPQNASSMNWIVWFIGLNLICLLLAALAVWLGWRAYTLTTTGEVTQARIVRLIEGGESDDLTPVFQFQVDGETYEVQSQNSYAWWLAELRFPEGKQIEIRYDPSNPELAEINSFWSVWGETILLSIFTVLFALGVNAYFVTRWRMNKT